MRKDYKYRIVNKPMLHVASLDMISIERIGNPSVFLVTAERWCKLRGNLLFYFKSGDPGSQPAGLIVLEDITVQAESQGIDGTFGLLILSGQKKVLQHFRSYTEEDRDSWKGALESASYCQSRSRVESLRNLIAKKRESEPSERCGRPPADPNQPPLLSCRFACEGLPSDHRGQPSSVRLLHYITISPSHGLNITRLVLLARNKEEEDWAEVGRTEFSEEREARFLLSASFYSHLGASDETQVTGPLKY